MPLINSRLTYFIIKITYPVKIAIQIKPITIAAGDMSGFLTVIWNKIQLPGIFPSGCFFSKIKHLRLWKINRQWPESSAHGNVAMEHWQCWRCDGNAPSQDQTIQHIKNLIMPKCLSFKAGYFGILRF